MGEATKLKPTGVSRQVVYRVQDDPATMLAEWGL